MINIPPWLRQDIKKNQYPCPTCSKIITEEGIIGIGIRISSKFKDKTVFFFEFLCTCKNKVLVELMKDDKIDSIIFSGGMGLSKKEITYETLEPRLEKKINGFGELFRYLTYNEIGTSAMLSRATAGILRSKKKSKAIFLLPGSPDAVRLALQNIIIPELGHILSIINKEE